MYFLRSPEPSRGYPTISNSEIFTDGVSSVVYACAQGYFRRGTSYISTYDRNTGIWSDVDVTCTFVNCGTPPSLHGAEVRCQSMKNFNVDLFEDVAPEINIEA